MTEKLLTEIKIQTKLKIFTIIIILDETPLSLSISLSIPPSLSLSLEQRKSVAPERSFRDSCCYTPVSRSSRFAETLLKER